MQAKENGIIIITADEQGRIFSKSNDEYYLFKDYQNINEIENFDKHIHALRSALFAKNILVNVAPFNYSVVALPLEMGSIKLTQYIFERWRINNVTHLTH